MSVLRQLFQVALLSLLRIILGSLFLFAAISKLTDQQLLQETKIAPYFWALLISVELWIGSVYLVRLNYFRYASVFSGIIVVSGISLKMFHLWDSIPWHCPCFGISTFLGEPLLESISLSLIELAMIITLYYLLNNKLINEVDHD
jgi:hypothetical protein